ncbi:hypothetical protein BAN20980_00293 [Burkholderia anthina]|uniref:Terminase n=1 Tax=Burkholderia anthina TaxID=179879 RepID=A0A6P2G1X9_9BURK|nr:hypothetical protein BAN20980_00293 [Burkholderia anthina]
MPLTDTAIRNPKTAIQVRAAIAVAQHTHPKKSEGGKNDAKAEAAKAAASKVGGPPPPPRLVVNKK